ncbi:DUF3331 domain-containing protein [Paraburkholderia sp. BL25I1N1]|uniref:DUF3331 domain-containing protein n=1 Tax=Paraburkholderia sp. BL25I1N1 TaxID=1938804 RepID=UPI000D0758A0|nr:DUF3331 domain-containing protein [Paraburkholderia sp. BL25I1N1]PRY06166.1 uncharacterized protein DUF3331 [Paraburkholderia sp. BL25I1N1]
MTQATHGGEDVIESTLMRLLDPSRTTGIRQTTMERLRASDARTGMTLAGAARDDTGRFAVRVQVVEVLSSSTVSLRWSDPLSGHMGEQLWHCVTARRRSFCALTGAPVKRGDRVYQPRVRGRNVPCNSDQMIHAVAIRALPGASSAGE